MQAHLDGKQEGRSLFARYMTATCIQLLKDSSYWEIPYGFVHPSGIQMVDSSFSVGYNKLCVSFAEEKQDVLTGQEGQISETIDEEECVVALDTLTEETNEIQSNNECGDLDEPEPEEGGKKWKISRQHQDGTISYIHIKQAIKLLLLREYITRCRQKRHWASKHLPRWR